MLGCVLLGLVALFCLGWFTGCSGDNGTSVPSRICYDKELGYSDVANGDYTEYASEWFDAACTGGRIGNDCVSYDSHTTIVKHVCLENVDDEPSTEPKTRAKGKDTTQFCYDTQVGFQYIVSDTSLYNRYHDRWVKETCLEWAGDECSKFDPDGTISITRCK